MQRIGDLLRGRRFGAAIVMIARRAQVAVLVAGLLSSSACYTYAAVPVTEPLAEQRVELSINDAGRVLLQRQLGPGALLVEGRVVEQNDAGLTLRVYRLTTLRGDATTWSGEVVEVPSTAVELVTRREFDRQRTMVAMAVSVGAVTLFVLSRSLFGGGLFQDDPGQGTGPIQVDIRR
jgi:HAMP domain-containing protein